jgi:hypothetical protein
MEGARRVFATTPYVRPIDFAVKSRIIDRRQGGGGLYGLNLGSNWKASSSNDWQLSAEALIEAGDGEGRVMALRTSVAWQLLPSQRGEPGVHSNCSEGDSK